MSPRRLLALTAVLLAAIVVAVLAVAGRDGENPPSAEPRAEEVAPPPAAEGTGGAGAPAIAPGTKLPATLVAGDRSLLPLEGGGLGDAAGATVQGSALTVLGITGQGFIAGSSELDRLYVLWVGEPPTVQTQVDLRGTVAEAPADPAGDLGLDADDAAVVERLGGYIAANDVSPTG